jgi:hypothetical protein
MSISQHKRGDTFDYSDQFAMTIDGVAVTNFTGMTGASQLRHAGNTALGIAADTLVSELVFSWIDAAQGLYRVRHNGSTSAWPLGVVRHDVQLTTAGGDVVSTPTELIQLVEDVTHG